MSHGTRGVSDILVCGRKLLPSTLPSNVWVHPHADSDGKHHRETIIVFCISIYFFYEVFNIQINSILMITSEYVLVTQDRLKQAWNVG